MDETSAIENLGALVEHQGRRHAERPLAGFPQGEISFATLRTRARTMAKALIASGVRRGAHVALLMPNCIEFVVSCFAILMAGGTAVPLSARLKRRDLAFALNHSDAQLLLTTDLIEDYVDFVNLLSEALPGLREADPGLPLQLECATRLQAVVLFGATRGAGVIGVEEFVRRGSTITDAALDATCATVGRDDPALMIYSSGTTGVPKGCRISHAALLDKWKDYSDLVSLRAGDTIWIPLPFFHIGGIGPIVAAVLRGAAFVSASRIEANSSLELIMRWGAQHWYPGLVSITRDVLNAARYDRNRLGFVKTVVCVGPSEVERALEAALPASAKILNLFGMSEGCGPITFTPPDDPVELRAGTEGLPMTGVEVRVAEIGRDQILSTGSPGEIQFRGCGSFLDYYKNPEATAATILAGGWIRTGDYGQLLPSGHLQFLGRLKDMLRVGGENVSATEIEGFLSTHSAVKVAQVVGRPDERYGEVPVAFIELFPGSTCSAAELISFCSGEIANFKIPREVLFVTQWPMSDTKIQKMKLREMLRLRPTGASQPTLER